MKWLRCTGHKGKCNNQSDSACLHRLPHKAISQCKMSCLNYKGVMCVPDDFHVGEVFNIYGNDVTIDSVGEDKIQVSLTREALVKIIKHFD